ncbi:MAG: EthD domain-containing protein [Ilumatobacteraceae bacterium]
MTLKLFDFWTRATHLTRDDALAQALRDDADRAPLLDDSVLRFVTNVGVPTSQAPPFDGIAEYWIRDGAHNVVTEGLARATAPHIGARQVMLASPMVHVDYARPHSGVKSMFLLTRRPELTRTEAVAYWRREHAPLVARTLGDHLVRYTTNVGLPMNLTGWRDECSPYDGVAELWLDLDADSMFEFVGSVAETLLPDERAFLGTYRIFLSDERIHRGMDDKALPG